MHNKYRVIAYKVLNQDVARSAIRRHKLAKVVDKDYGAVYEFGNFKQITNKINKHEYNKRKINF